MYYKLTDNKEAVPCSFEEWSQQFEHLCNNDLKHVAKDIVNGKMVSTVWLGLDHQYGDGGEPHLFETMVFEECENIGMSIHMKHHSTWKDAEEGHQEAIDWVKANHE